MSWCSLSLAQLAHLCAVGQGSQAPLPECLSWCSPSQARFARMGAVGLGFTSSPRPKSFHVSEGKFCPLWPLSLWVVLAFASSARMDLDSVACQESSSGLGKSAEGVVAVFPPLLDMGEAPRTVVASFTPPRHRRLAELSFCLSLVKGGFS